MTIDGPTVSPAIVDTKEPWPRALLASFKRSVIFYLFIPIVLTLISYGTGNRDQLWLTALVNYIATFGIGVTTQLVYFIGERYAFTLPLGLHHVAFLAVGTVLGTEVTLAALSLIGSFDVWKLRNALWLIGAVVGCVNAAITTLYDRLRDQARAEEIRAEQAQQAAVRAELDALRARVHPHFLFNALNTVAALVEEDAKQAAVEAIERLSNLMRYSLEGDAIQSVALKDELCCVEDYLSLEALRFPTRMHSRLTVNGNVRPQRLSVPRFVLQPSVENAVKHGVAASDRPVAIDIHVELESDRLRLCVSDDGPGSSHHTGTKTSQVALRSRLTLMYGDAATMRAGAKNGGGYEVEVMLPIVDRSDDDD